MSESLGAWTNAPLAYVLVEVRTERLADIKNYQPAIAGQLRGTYPIQRAMHTTKLIANGSQVVIEQDQDMAWEFATPENRTAVILRPTGLVLHATTYIDSSDFFARLAVIMKVLAKEVPSVYVNRLGMRYIDFILPKHGEEPEAYVNPRLNPDLKLTQQAGGIPATSLAIYPMPSGPLTLRYVRGRGKPEMPPDLGMTSLHPSPLMNTENLPNDQPTAVLDTDQILVCSPVEPLDPTRVLNQFEKIHKDISSVFKIAVTDHARAMWGAK